MTTYEHIDSYEPIDSERKPLSEVEWARTYDLAHEVLRSTKFASALHNRASYPIFGHAVLTLSGKEHLARRRTELPLFSRENIQSYQEAAVGPALRGAIEQLRADADGEEVVVDLNQLVQLSLVRATAAIIGIGSVDTDDDAADLQRIAAALGIAASVEFSTLDVDVVIDAALQAKREFIDRFYLDGLRRAQAEMAAAAADDAAERDGEGRPANLLRLLLEAYPGWDDDDLIRECLFFLTASGSTTNNASPHLFRELAEWFDAHPEDRPLAEDVVFMQKAAGEALRLFPPVPALIRRALEDVELSDGRLIRRGELVAVDTNAANRDRDRIGPDADRFDPRREIGGKIHPSAVSFGLGPHACPGRPVAIGSFGRDVEDAPEGILVVIMQELFRQGARLADEPPTVREEMDDLRYSRFPIALPAR
ncbi:MAG: cytochrome P450 [Acidimicrobiia bacterium]